MSKTTTDLETFIRSKAGGPSQGEPEMDWQARKSDWLKNIEALYEVVQKWLEPLEREGVVSFLTANITSQTAGSSIHPGLISRFAQRGDGVIMRVSINPDQVALEGTHGSITRLIGTA